jgi:uncharacterized protein YPO0396
VRKLDVAPGSFTEWVGNELKARFDHECITDLAAFRSATRAAVTPQGLVKHNLQRHEKADRRPVDDRRNWVLGFDNAAKLQLFRADAQALAETIAALMQRRDHLEEAETRQREQVRHGQLLVNQTWSEIDVLGMVRKVDELARRIGSEREARPNQQVLDKDIACQEKVHEFAAGKVHQLQAEIDQWTKARDEHEATRERLDARLLETELALPLQQEIDARFAATAKAVTLRNIGELMLLVERRLHDERSAVQRRSAELSASIERRLAYFVRIWAAESSGLDAGWPASTTQLAETRFLAPTCTRCWA